LFWLNKALTSKANPIGINIARDKNLTIRLLQKLGYPVAPSEIISNLSELESAIENIPFPVVLKPVGSAEGKGVTVNIKTRELLLESFEIAVLFDKKILIEKYILGDYYRLTYIADGSYAATKNIPAYIKGDGKKTAKELIEDENKNNKERGHRGRLKKITISEKAARFLASEGYDFNSIIPEDKKIPLCFSGFDGGEYINATKDVHPYFIEMAKKISNILELPIIGIDIIASSIEKPLPETGGVVLEINGTYPDIQFHNVPTKGDSINLAPKLIDYLFN
ncbi:ATP-grasp domain-containing protein, partial [Patescibacteria group bacterium]|nr:ATP-grasp domain-containing protein [Patescibacteria group bacterium]